MKSLSQLNAYSTSTVVYVDQTLGGGQVLANRYQINGLLDTAKPVLENIELMTNAAGSWLSYDIHEGKWGVVINQTSTYIASFDDSNIIGNISLSGTGLRDLYNSVKVEFPNRDLRDSADFIQDEIPDVDRNANEVDNVLNITYDIINDPVQAELLGLLELKQSRVDLVISFRTDFTYVNLKAGDVVNITNDRYSFVNKPFRIVTIAEIQDDDGALQMEITALEYSDDVYVADLYKYTRTDSNGIITIGSIGKPGTPQVTKFEQNARPRVLIESLAPTGIVEGLEFWLSTDVAEADDDLRSYRLIATRRPVNGGTFSSGDNITLDYDSLGDTNFVIKTRGVNSTTVGQYSDPSGFVYFAPVQTTDAISPDTLALDATGGLLTALAVIDLLKGVDGLFGGSTSTSSMFTKIFDIFKDVTGVDLVEDAGSTEIVANKLVTRDEGTIVNNNTTCINFTGAGVTTSYDGSCVNVVVPGGGGGGGGEEGGSAVIETTSAPKLALNYYPSNGSVTAPTSGSYWVEVTGSVYSAVSKGTGTARLYKTDGTLIQTVNASAFVVYNNFVEIPFTTARAVGTDYYILLTEGAITYCDGISPALSCPTDWRFTTPLYSVSALSFAGSLTPDTGTNPAVVSVSPSGSGQCTVQDLIITYDRSVEVGTGSIYIKRVDDDSTVATIDAASGLQSILNLDGTVNKTKVNYGSLEGIVPFNTQLYIASQSGIVYSYLDCNIAKNLPNITKEQNFTFTVTSEFALTGFSVTSAVVEDPDLTKTNLLSSIALNFNRTAQAGVGSFTLYNDAGLVHQQFDISDTFEADKVGGLIGFSGNQVILNPTVALTLGRTYYLRATANTVKDYVSSTPDYSKIIASSSVSAITINIPIKQDAIVEPNETITVTLGGLSLTKTITDQNGVILYTGGSVVTEGSVASFTFNFNKPTTKANTLTFTVTGTAATTDYGTIDIIGGSFADANNPPGSCIITPKGKSCTNYWAGILDNNTVRFTAERGPVLQVFPVTPTNTSTGVISMTYDRPITASTGSVRIIGPSGEVYALPGNWPGIIYN